MSILQPNVLPNWKAESNDIYNSIESDFQYCLQTIASLVEGL